MRSSKDDSFVTTNTNTTNSNKKKTTTDMTSWWSAGAKPAQPERVPTDTVVPVGFFDDTLIFRTFTVYVMFVYDEVLDVDHLHDGMTRLISRPGWNKAGARLRKAVSDYLFASSDPDSWSFEWVSLPCLLGRLFSIPYARATDPLGRGGGGVSRFPRPTYLIIMNMGAPED